MTPDQIAYATGPGFDALLPTLMTLALICGIVCALIAPSKGQVPWKWWVLGCVGGLLTLSVLACLPRRPVAVPASATASPHTLRRIGD